MTTLKLKIVGSGGMSIIPSSFCKCKICEEAREKARPEKQNLKNSPEYKKRRADRDAR